MRHVHEPCIGCSDCRRSMPWNVLAVFWSRTTAGHESVVNSVETDYEFQPKNTPATVEPVRTYFVSSHSVSVPLLGKGEDVELFRSGFGRLAIVVNADVRCKMKNDSFTGLSICCTITTRRLSHCHVHKWKRNSNQSSRLFWKFHEKYKPPKTFPEPHRRRRRVLTPPRRRACRAKEQVRPTKVFWPEKQVRSTGIRLPPAPPNSSIITWKQNETTFSGAGGGGVMDDGAILFFRWLLKNQQQVGLFFGFRYFVVKYSNVSRGSHRCRAEWSVFEESWWKRWKKAWYTMLTTDRF